MYNYQGKLPLSLLHTQLKAPIEPMIDANPCCKATLLMADLQGLGISLARMRRQVWAGPEVGS